MKKPTPQRVTGVNAKDLLHETSCKIIIKNNSKENCYVELFNKNNKLSFSSSIHVSDKVIIKAFGEESTQTYADFFESILDCGAIIISKVTTTNNKQLQLFQRDLIKGKEIMKEPIMDRTLRLDGRTIMKIELLPKQKFEIKFLITARRANYYNYTAI